MTSVETFVLSVSCRFSSRSSQKAKASDWYYYSPYEYIYDYEDLNWYDYFLVRGYAFISSAGLGTKGSEGFHTTGSDLEINAFKNIIEWVNGKRKAYTDKTSNVEIKADWAKLGCRNDRFILGWNYDLWCGSDRCRRIEDHRSGSRNSLLV